jgi:CheY-like chemotaxis protein
MVDDEPDFQTVMHAWLEPDYEHIALANGVELLGALRTGVPDLVILDFNLPGSDGAELCRRIRGTPGLETLPVIFLTGSHEIKNYRETLRAGGTSFLMKPIGRRKLIGAIESLLADRVQVKPLADVGGGD